MQTEPQSTRKKKITIWNGSWSNGTPNANANVVLNSVYNTGVNGSFGCNNLEINANLTIAADTQIKVLGPLVKQSVSSTFVVANKGQFILLHPLVDTATVKLTANFTPQTLLGRLDYWYLSSPISDISVAGISPATLTTRIYEYGYGAGSDGAYYDGYSVVDVAARTMAAKGYMIRTPNNFPTTPGNWNITVNNLSGGSINKGVIFNVPTFTTNHTVGPQGFYMIGNPYLANLDLRKFLQYNSKKIKDLIYIWYKTNNSDRESYVQLNSIESRSGAFSTKIRPFQAFIVQFTDAANTGTELIFTPDMQITEKNFDHNYFTLDYKQSSVNIPVGSCTYNADTFEASFYTSSSSSALLAFIKDGVNMVLYRDIAPYDGQIIDLYYSAVATENFTISLPGFDGTFSGFKILLLDTQLNTSTDLKAGPYTFAGVSGESSAGRFKIKITAL